MNPNPSRRPFSENQIEVINQAVTISEDLVSNHYKMSASQWLHRRYDVKTLAELTPHEIVDGPFAQIIRYEGQRRGSALGSLTYDFYKICLQDHAIIGALSAHPDLQLLPFGLYIICHELVHIVRFSKFLQNFDASVDEKLAEEHRVHDITHQILLPVRMSGIEPVIGFYQHWRKPLESLGGP